MKKIISILTATFLVMAGVAVVANSVTADDPVYIETITLEVRTTQETGLGDTAVGDLDVFIQSVPGELYDGISDEWKANLGTWMSSGSYNNLFLNPAFDKETQDDYPETELTMIGGGLPVIEVDGEWQFNPLADRHIRFANNFMVDRTQYLEDLYDGYGTERYMAMGQEGPGYEEYYRPIVEMLEVDQDGDFDRAFNMIQDRMNYWANHDGIADWTGETLENTGTETDPVWEFGGEQIELISANRIEDERLSIGHDWSDKMEDMGFAVDRVDGEGATLFGMTLFANPASMTFHMYTGGWIASAANGFQEAAMNQMYLGWYGWTAGMGSPDHWQVRAVQSDDIEQIGRDLMGGRAPTMERYWEWMQAITEYGIQESVRVFLVSTHDFFVYDSSRVAEAATDIVTGWAGIWSPRTLKIRDPDGAFKAAQYSSVGALYMDNWNRIDGSGDTYSMQQQDMARDFSFYNHPSRGMPIGVRSEFEYEEDYYWDGDDLIREMDVPEGAWDYDPFEREWVQVGDDIKSANSVTYDFYETGDGDLGKFHDGNPMTYRDLMYWYAFSKSLTYEVEDDRYHYGPWGDVAIETFANIKGIEFHEEGGEVTSYTVYGDYAFPDEGTVASFYSTTVFKPWQVYEAARILIDQHEDESDLWEGVDGAGEVWSWSEAENWIHFISRAQGESFVQVMENIIDNDWIPEYLETMPEVLGDVDVATEVQRSIDFFDNHEHLFISQGPFRIIEIDEPNMVMEMERWSYDDNNYPLPEDHWEDRLVVRRFEIRRVTMPSRVDAGQEFEIEARARIREDYPERRTYDADEGEVTARIPGTDRVAEGVLVEDGLFRIDVDSDFTEGLTGTQLIRIEGTIEGAVAPAVQEVSLLVIGVAEADIQVSDFDVDPVEGPAPLEVSVSAMLENVGDETGDISVMIDGDVHDTVTLEAGETRSYTEIFTLEEEGEYVIALGDRSTTVTVTEPIEDLEVSNFVVSPDEGEAPLDVEITADVFNPTGDEITFDVKAAGTVIADYTVGADETVSVDETHTFDEPGDYIVQVHRTRRVVRVAEEEVEPANIVVSNFEVDPDEGEAPLEVEITADLENQGGEEGTIDLIIDGDVYETYTLGPGDTLSISEEYEFEDHGDYDIELGGHVRTVEVEKETPGFTLAILAIAAVVAVVVYHSKKSDE